MSTLAAAAALAFSAALGAQAGRYRDEVFSAASVQSDQQYGAAVNQSTQALEPLLLDIYEPAGDLATARAAVVVVHGGGFVGGSKNAPTCVLLAQDLARRGYVAVSINYRLATGMVTPTVVRDASHDMKAAVRWLRANVPANAPP